MLHSVFRAVLCMLVLHSPERGIQRQRALPLLLCVHTLGKKSRHSELFSGKLPSREVWYFNSVSALCWREVVFLTALLIRWELLHN